MTFPRQAGQSPLDRVASAAISGARQRLTPVDVSSPTFTDEERAEVEKMMEEGKLCRFCATIHVGANTPGCPRISSGKINADGQIVEFTFWDNWDHSRVLFPDDVYGGEADVDAK
jgi:hypothetical protein